MREECGKSLVPIGTPGLHSSFPQTPDLGLCVVRRTGLEPMTSAVCEGFDIRPSSVIAADRVSSRPASPAPSVQQMGWGMG